MCKKKGVSMRPNIVSPEILEDILQALVRAGGYQSKKAAVGHALEVLLVANPHLRTQTAIELYRRGKVTLSRAAEIAQLELEALKDQLAEKDLPLRIDEPPDEVRSGADLIHRLRGTCDSR
jgi:predicted HTH domain antitoxin